MSKWGQIEDKEVDLLGRENVAGAIDHEAMVHLLKLSKRCSLSARSSSSQSLLSEKYDAALKKMFRIALNDVGLNSVIDKSGTRLKFFRAVEHNALQA